MAQDSGKSGGGDGGSHHKNPEIEAKVKRAIGLVSENMHILANEPSLALFCLQEHIRKEVPNMIKQRSEFSHQHRLLQGTCYDCDYSIGAVKSIEKSEEKFKSIQELLKNSLFLKQQLKFQETRRKNAAKLKPLYGSIPKD